MNNGEKLLREKYKDGYLFMDEVGNRPGRHKSRAIDYMTFGLWQSTGYEIQAFERKDSRSDWLRELKDLSKSDATMKMSDRFWLYSAKGVAKKEEVPSSWGWMEFTDDKISIKRGAPLLREHEGKLDRMTMASMLHAHHRWVSRYAQAIAANTLSDKLFKLEADADKRLKDKFDEANRVHSAAQKILDSIGVSRYEVMYRDQPEILKSFGVFLNSQKYAPCLRSASNSLKKLSEELQKQAEFLENDK